MLLWKQKTPYRKQIVIAAWVTDYTQISHLSAVVCILRCFILIEWVPILLCLPFLINMNVRLFFTDKYQTLIKLYLHNLLLSNLCTSYYSFRMRKKSIRNVIYSTYESALENIAKHLKKCILKYYTLRKVTWILEFRASWSLAVFCVTRKKTSWNESSIESCSICGARADLSGFFYLGRDEREESIASSARPSVRRDGTGPGACRTGCVTPERPTVTSYLSIHTTLLNWMYARFNQWNATTTSVNKCFLVVGIVLVTFKLPTYEPKRFCLKEIKRTTTPLSSYPTWEWWWIVLTTVII